MICSKCGTKNNEGEKFCIKCGNNFEGEKLNISQQSNNDLIQNDICNNGNVNNSILSNTSNNLADVNRINNKLNLLFKPKMLFIFIGCGILLVTIGVAISNVSKIGVKNNSNSTKLNNNTSFFVKNKENKYALFNQKGKKLTDFDFSVASEIVNDTAIVYKDDKVGIISGNGKMIASFGKYDEILRKGSFYKVTKNESEYLIDSKGKNIFNLKNMQVFDYMYVYNFVILKNEETNKYIIVDSKGKDIYSFPVVKNSDKIKVSEEDGFASIYYNNKNYILNIDKKKLITSFDDVDRFCISDIFNNRNSLLISSCASFFSEPTRDSYKVIEKGKVIDLDKECDSIGRDSEKIICTSNGKDYFLDDNYKKVSEASYTAFDNEFNYVRNNYQDDEGVNFYNDGKIIKHIPCSSLGKDGFMPNGLFILAANDSKCGTKPRIYNFYKSNGEKAFDKGFKSILKIDKNNNYIVSEDDIYYYLIDEKGNQKSEKYTKIKFSGDFYIITKDTGTGMLDKTGKEIIPCNYSDIRTFLANEKKYAKLLKKDSSVVVYDLWKQKEVFSSSEDINTLNYYIEVNSSGKRQLYSYITGKLFYEE